MAAVLLSLNSQDIIGYATADAESQGSNLVNAYITIAESLLIMLYMCVDGCRRVEESEKR